MHIWVDADACPAVIKDILFRAADVIAKGGHALNPRGEFYTTESIQERLALRNYLDELRGTGVRTGGPEALGNADRKRFADQLDRFLARQGKE